MSQFEDNLWGAVVDRHGADLARADASFADASGRARVRRARPRLLASATGAVAASAAAITLLVSASASPTPAFAVSIHARSVSVKIYRQSGIAGANRKLAAMGIHERVSDLKDGQSITLPCLAPGPGPDGNTLTFAGTPKGYASVGGPAVGSTWHLVACSSIVSTGNTGNTGAG